MAIFVFPQNGGRSPSWICYARSWRAHVNYLMVFIAVQFGWNRCRQLQESTCRRRKTLYETRRVTIIR